MESKTITRLEVAIRNIENEIEWKTQRMEALVREMKESVAKYDTYQIVNFVPGYIRQIEELHNEVRKLEEQKRILVWIEHKEEEDA